MADDSAPSSRSSFPADDGERDARWLAGLIQALRTQLDHAGRPEVAAILDDAFAAAQAAVERTRRTGSPH